MLDLDPSRATVAPRDAATLVLVRDHAKGVEVFCVERHKDSKFMGGALVFPGGKLDAQDRDPAWAALTTRPPDAAFAEDLETRRALAVAACRETLEEATLLPVAGASLTHDELLILRARLASGETLAGLLAPLGLRLDLAALHPLARWVTPVSESRRYDTRFFVLVATPGDRGAHDEHETTDSLWAKPEELLLRYEEGLVQLAPPTHRTLSILARLSSASEAVELARRACLDPICPELHQDGETIALVLPGDPAHSIRERRIDGPTRFVLKGARWCPEDAPVTVPPGKP